MDAATTALVRELLAATDLGVRTRAFGKVLRRSASKSAQSSMTASGLLLVGTPTAEPWHLAAHLDDEARLCGAPELSPTLVRWAPPLYAPPHLAVDMRRLEQIGRRETVFVVAPDQPPEGLLERVADARRHGATVLALDCGDDELSAVAHDSLIVTDSELSLGSVGPGAMAGIEIAQHLVSSAASETSARSRTRERIAHALEIMVGATPRD